MNDKILVGIDCGDRTVKAAYIVDSKVFGLPIPIDVSEPSIYLDPNAREYSIGVGFPSLLQKIGTYLPFSMNPYEEMSEPSTVTPESVVTQQLTSIHQGIINITGKSIRTTVIAVSSSLSQAGRKALLDCSRTAGFKEVSLVDKCTAAAYTTSINQEEPRTLLVFSLNYGDCEYSLIRLSKDRCRVVASGTVPSFSGEMLNALIMEATVLALRKQRIFLGLKQFTSLHWYMFRSIAEEVRQALGKQSETQAILPPRLTGLDEQIQVLYKTDSFAARIASSMGKAIDGMHGLLDQNALEDTDIDTILLIGNAANTSPVYDILNSSFPDKLNRTAQNHVAMGAALHATKIAGQDQEISLDMHHLRISGVEDAQHLVQSFDKISLEDDSKQHSEFAELIGYANKHIEKQQPLPSQSFLGQDVSLNAAKKLIEEGKREEAMSVLGALSHEIEKLITKMQLDGKLAIPRTLIRQAYAMINTGNFHNAVNLSHKAYNQALDDPEIFTDMMKIHAECSLAMDRPEQYEDAINVLLCAYGHDQTDRSIHKALAERHNMHAIAMRKLNNLSKAYEIVNTALTYDPKHAGANKLLQELTDKSSLS